MGAKEQNEKQGFWGRYKFYILGLVGSILLIASMSVQNIVLNYTTVDGNKYAVKLDYSAFGLCLRCFGTTDNANAIVEEAIFFCATKEKSVERAAEGLQKIAGTEEGTFQVITGGILGGNEKKAAETAEYLTELGYEAEVYKKG
ncbi:MAG: hypothetical protein IJP27_02635 [Clostridia bacterium]|nr:hypothetical protein [Clostridia bacterium]